MAGKTYDFKTQLTLGGDRAYKDSMKDVNRTIAKLNSDMRASQSAFKGQEDSMEALQDKLEKLNAVYDEQEAKVKLVAAKLDDLKTSGKGSQKEIDNLTIELNKAQTALNNTRAEIDKTTDALNDLSAADSAGAKLSAFAGKVTDLGGKAAGVAAGGLKLGAGAVAAVGAAAIGAGVALTNMGAEFTQATNDISAKTGATGAELEALGAIAVDVWKNNFGENIGEVSEALAITSTNTRLVGDELKMAAEAGFALRDTFGFEFEESSRTASSLMRQFGLSAEEAYNLIAAGAQEGANRNGDMLDVLSEYAPQYAAIGLSANDMMNTLIAGAENGVFQVDKVGDAVKEFQIRAIDGSNTTRAAFEQLGLDADATAAQLAAGGEQGRDAFLQVVDALQGMSDPLAQNQAAVSLFGTQYEDLGAQALPILASIAEGGALSATALDQINTVKYDDAASAIQGLGRSLQAELLPTAEGMEEAVKGVCTTAIGALEDGFQPEDIRTIGQGVLDAFGEGFGDPAAIGEKAGAMVSEIVKFVVDAAPQMVTAAGALAMGLLDGLAAGLGVGEAWEKVKNAISTVCTGVIDFFKNLFGIHSPSTLTTEIGGFLLAGIGEGLLGGLEAVLSTVGEVFGRIWEAIKSIFGFGGDDDEASEARQAGTDIMSGMVDGITGSEDDLEAAAQDAADLALSTIRTALGVSGGPSTITTTYGEAIVAGIAGGITDESNTAFTAPASTLAGKAKSALEKAVGKGGSTYKYIGEMIASGVATGITNNASKITKAARSAAQAAYNSAKDELGIASPSRRMMEIGFWFDAGFAKGIEDNMRSVIHSAQQLSSRAAVSATPTRSEAAAFEIDYDRLGAAVARANRAAGIGTAVVDVDGRRFGETIEPHASRAAYQRSTSTIKGRASRMVLV